VTRWWARLASYALPHNRDVLLTLILTLALVALDTLKPWPIKLIVDHVLTAEPLPASAESIRYLPGATSALGLLAWLTASSVLLFGAAWLCRVSQLYVKTGLGTRMTYDLGADLFDHLQRLSLRFHGRRPTGDLVQRVINDSGCARELIVNVVMPLLTSLLSLCAMFALVWTLDPNISFIVLLAVPLLGVLIPYLAKPMADRRYAHSTNEGRVLATAEQTLTALPIVQACGRESYEDARFRKVTEETGQTYQSMIAAEMRFQVGTTSVTALGSAAVLVLGGLHVLQGDLSVGSLLVVLSYVTSVYAPLETLAWLSSGFASAIGQARRVIEIFDVECEIRDSPHAKGYRPADSSQCGHVRLERVTFGYELDRPVLKDVTLDVRPGETIALVGATGAGKSTLVGLIMRFYDPNYGRITFDGTDLRDLRVASLRAQFSIVLQDPFILPLSVADNIAYGQPDATREQVLNAARAANADRFIRALPEAYDTVVGERGATLSGGERQRIAIARALLKDAPILILDEPTASLDAETESDIMDALNRLMKGRTTFIIAHRFSTIRAADRIVVLEQGQLVESGTHEQLMDARGAYRRMYDAQALRASAPDALRSKDPSVVETGACG
jgi:ABC-type multidrug transport system fused ATPase/permease subunit